MGKMQIGAGASWGFHSNRNGTLGTPFIMRDSKMPKYIFYLDFTVIPEGFKLMMIRISVNSGNRI